MSTLGNFLLVFSHTYIHDLWDFSFNKNTNHPVVIVNYFSLYSYKTISPHQNIFLQHHFKTRVKVPLFEWTQTNITKPPPPTPLLEYVLQIAPDRVLSQEVQLEPSWTPPSISNWLLQRTADLCATWLIVT